MKYEDCDYVLDRKNNFYIVKGYWNFKNILCSRVFALDPNGERYNTLLKRNFRKVLDFGLITLSKKEVKRIFEPFEFYASNKSLLKGVWAKIALQLEKYVGEDLGIFGSFLLGFEVKKDVDFVIRGVKNCIKLKKKMQKIREKLGFTSITKEHINYQVKKYGAFHNLRKNSFEKMFKNKWSAIQIKPGLLTTIRFIYKEKEIPENIFENRIVSRIKVAGEVIEDIGSNFCPRYFKIKSKNEIFTIGTYYWVYQSCVKVGDKVIVEGNLRKNCVITLDGPNDGVIIS